MKKLFIIIVIFVAATASATAQQWAPTGAKWHYTEWFAFSGDISYLSIESVGDTVIQGINCKILQKNIPILCSERPYREYMYSNGGQVYFWDFNFNMFQMLYDFDATGGQSWNILLKDSSDPNDVDTLVISVDSTGVEMINGFPKKRLMVHYELIADQFPYDYKSVIVESIGDMNYMFNFMPEMSLVCDANGSGGLRCYEDSIVGLYETGIAESCTFEFQWQPGACNAFFFWEYDALNNIVNFSDFSNGSISQWMWTFGDGDSSYLINPSHEYLNPGAYLVRLTISGADSCFSTYSDTVYVNPTGCPNYFNYQVVNLTADFSGHLTFGGTASYQWDFGDGITGTGANISHTYEQPATYSVTLTTITADSCTYTSNQIIIAGDTAQYHQVWGQVFAGSFPLEYGKVIIMAVDTTGGYFPYMDEMNIDSSGIYYFSYVPDGSYYIRATPGDGPYMPTYYGNAVNWQDATIITLGEPANPYNIDLVGAPVMNPGNGNITGNVAGNKLSSNYVEQINMLIRSDNEIKGYAPVDAGSFVFSNIELGSYSLVPDLPGCKYDNIDVSLTQENPDAVVNLTYSNGSILGINDQYELTEEIKIYPVPVHDILNISVLAKKGFNAEAEIYDLSGRQMLNEKFSLNKGTNHTGINLRSLSEGTYILAISAEGLQYRKMISVVR